MESSGIQLPGYDDAGSSGANIEIKVKTMDSQTYTLQVDKQVPVPALKEQIATVTGVVTEQQRLICRGKVLKDDQLLSAYHVEDGHTLHLVVRQPTQSSMDNSAPDSAFGASTGTQSQYLQVAPGVLVEMYSMSGQGDRNLSDIGRVVSAVLGSIGLSNLGNFDEGASARDHTSERISTRGDATEATQQPTEQPGTSTNRLRPRNAVGVTSGLSFGSLPAPVIPDAVSTLSQYLSHMRNEFNANDAGESGPVCIESSSLPSPGNSQAGLPTPESLAELLIATRQTLIQHIGESLAQLSRELENQAAVTDPDVRSLTQSSAMRTGMFLQNLGAYLLELGRTVMTLRLGRSPSEAVVNAGPPVFISPSGPNPLMVQPLPFHPGSSFSSSQVGTSPPSGSGLSHGLTSGLIPRRIDIQIRRGSLARPDGLHQQNSGQRESSTGGDGEAVTNQSTMASSNLPSFGGSGGRSVRVVPLRSMASAIPDLNRAPSSLPGNLSGLYYPLFGRYQNAVPRYSTGGRIGAVVTGEHRPPSVQQTEQEPSLERQSQSQDTENPSENGQRESPPSRTIDISIYSSGGVHNDQNSSEGQLPDSVMELLRGLFPGGEFQVESMSPVGTTNPAESYTEQGNTSSAAYVSEATERRATEDGISFSRMLRQMMPYITNLSGSGQNSTISNPGGGNSSSTQAESSEQGSSRRRSDDEIDEPDAKRHKHME